MPNESAGFSLISTITRLIDNNINEGADLDNLVTVLSLLCLICVFTRQHGVPMASHTPKDTGTANPVNKIISDLMKGGNPLAGGAPGGAGGMDALMSLLPLLNNPQLKSKLNPSTISSVLGMLNDLGGSPPEKQDSSKEPPTQKAKEASKEEKQAVEEDFSKTNNHNNDDDEQENKSLGRYLNWKTNF
jgi:hypothetical protein